MPIGYVANWGNDQNDGLSWATAKKTPQSAVDFGLSPVYINGWYDTDDLSLIGNVIGYAKIYGQNRTLNYYTAYVYPYMNKVEIYEFNYLMLGQNGYRFGEQVNCMFSNGNVIGRGMEADSTYSYYGVGKLNGCVLNNIRSVHISDYYEKGHLINTYHNIGTIFLISGYQKKPTFAKCIISNAKISQPMYGDSEYTLYINTSFKLWNGGLGTDEIDYAYPIGATDDEKLQNLRERMATVYGGQASDYLVGCKYYSGSYNDIFVDADKGNFYLNPQPNNPALHMSYDGKYIGAKPPAIDTIKVSDSDIVSRNNIDLTGKILDQEAQADIISAIHDIGKVIEAKSIEAIADIAYRNALSINAEPYVSADISAGANVLTNGSVYQVIDSGATGGTIVLDDAANTVYQAFDTFTAVDEGSGAGLGFSSTAGLIVREININAYDECVVVRSSLTDSLLSTASAIRLKIHETPMVNVDVNGEPLKGNADSGFDEATAVPWKFRYWKVEAIIQPDQLYAR